MKCVIAILLLINVACYGQDSIMVYSHHYLIEKEIACCKTAKNQLKCVDSLIQANLNATNNEGKIDPQKAYLNRLRKLGIYHFYAGIISGLRGNPDQSFAYYDKMDRYLDTLNQLGKGEEFKTLISIARHQKTESCINTYRKDTAAFNRCNCMQFFPEVKDASLTADTATSTGEKQIVPIKYPNWGEFYINDTLRINKHFVSDSNSIVFFRKSLQLLLLSKFSQNPTYFELLGTPSFNLVRDTVIYKLSSRYEKGKYERNCELVFTSSRHPEMFDYFMLSISNIEFPEFVRDLEIYIPIVLTTNESIYASRSAIYDDHFLIEVVKQKPIKLH